MSTGCIVGLVIGLFGLVVFIGVLAGLAIPAASGVMKKAMKVRTQAAMKDIQLGLKNCHVEYQRYPCADGATGVVVDGTVINALMGGEKQLNPREIKYIDPPMARTQSGGLESTDAGYRLVDFYGHEYRASVAKAGATEVPDPEHPGVMLPSPVIVWSAGEDGDFNTWRDNVASWKRVDQAMP